MKKTAIVTGSNGLIGSASVRRFCQHGYDVVGIDNDMRRYFFGAEASTRWVQAELQQYSNFRAVDLDIQDVRGVFECFEHAGRGVDCVIHTAAQPSHDWAAREPLTDFGVNAVGTINLLEATRQFCPEATFIFTSTNKVYGDRPNELPLIETATRWEIAADHPYSGRGIGETMPIDQCMHSVFGASKVAADVMVQEYGRYFGLRTGVFRGGCLTGPQHSGAELHGFLAYLMKCAATGRPYTVFGYKGKQVRDNIHCDDLVSAFWEFCQAPRPGEVYNIGGGIHSNVSMLEAIEMCEEICGRKLNYQVSADNRVGDHKWYVSDLTKFMEHFPRWSIQRTISDMLDEMYHANHKRWST